MEKRKLMVIVVYLDDEFLGLGGILVKYVVEGVEVSVLMVIKGEWGRFGIVV